MLCFLNSLRQTLGEVGRTLKWLCKPSAVGPAYTAALEFSRPSSRVYIRLYKPGKTISNSLTTGDAYFLKLFTKVCFQIRRKGLFLAVFLLCFFLFTLSESTKSLTEFFSLSNLSRYGVVLKELGLKEDALEVFVEAVEKEPLHWGSWSELALLCKTKEQVLQGLNYKKIGLDYSAGEA